MATAKQQEPLLPAYIVSGNDELKRNAVLKRLRARLAEADGTEAAYDVFSGDVAAGAEIVTVCNTIPFPSSMRIVQVNEAQKLKKPDIEAIANYLGNPFEQVVLVFVAESIPKNNVLYKTVQKLGKQAIIDCTGQKGAELIKTIRSVAVGHNATISDGAARLLVEYVGTDMLRIDAELKKLVLAHQGNGSISEAEVKDLVGRTAEVKPWEFVDAFAARDIKNCMRCLSLMETASPHALLAACTTRIRELITASSLAKRGSAHMLASTLGMPDWRVKNHQRWARGFTEEELRHALISARDAERAMKSGADAQEAFLEWVLSTIKK